VKRILITGVAGFIGFHLVKRLMKDDFYLVGIDNINDYYDINLKNQRLKNLEIFSKNNNSNWKFFKSDLVDEKALRLIFYEYKPDVVINLAAQAGVRYSLENPREYIYSNIVGFMNILELCKENKVKNLIYASSSSVYGLNKKIPFLEKHPVNHPISIYASSKISNELMAHTYSHLFNIPCTGLRFFTVYGPWGRPDMAPMIFTKAIFSKSPIEIFNHGNMWRDFTYVDDVIESIIRLINNPAKRIIKNKLDIESSETSMAPNEIFNIGNNNPIKLLDFIEILEDEIGIKAIKKYREMQKGDVEKTFADSTLLSEKTGFSPKTSIRRGIKEFISWYKEYYRIN